MQFSEEWKSLFPISYVHSPPLLLRNSELGPLFFNPVSESLSLLFSSSDLSPPFRPSPSHLPLTEFLRIHDSAIIPSAVAASFDSSRNSNILLRNRIEPLYCPDSRVLIFFPTGSNFDCVGFLVLSVRDSKLCVDFCSDGSVLTSQVTFNHQIIQLTSCAISDYSFDEGGSACVGYLLACNTYAANWFSVKISGNSSDSNKPSLVFMGSKKFTSMVAHACWNPHLPGQCVVLLESGALNLFDMNYSSDKRFYKTTISVPWDEVGESAGSEWFSCEFSWHPQILVVANAKSIYIVDFRFKKFQLNCLLRIDRPGVTDLLGKDKFVLFSKANSNGSLYTVATEQWLLLCDVCKPLMPVLRWAHHLRQPCYMTVLPLSELRTMPYDKHAKASAVILGSFWNKEFSFFCYGHPHPAITNSSSSELSDFSNSFYAWELPSPFLLSGQNCLCGNCLLKEEFLKDDIPEWIEWQQKQELVLGFCILKSNISSLLPKLGDHGSFALIRLMSTGKLESQQYCASRKMSRIAAAEHEEIIPLKDSLLCSMVEEKYKFPRRFRYIKLQSLYDYLNHNFAESISTKFRNTPVMAGVKKVSNVHSEKSMSDSLKSFGIDPSISHLSVANVFGDVNMPTILYEVNSRLTWTKLPSNLLDVAFPGYSEVHKSDQQQVSSDFPAILDGNQPPPFFLRNPSHCRSTKKRLGGDIMGPVIPLPTLTVLKVIPRHGYSIGKKENEISHEDVAAPQYEYLTRLTKEMCSLSAGYRQDKEYAVSLKQEWDEPWENSLESCQFFSYKPSAFLDEVEDDNGSVLGERYNTIVARTAEYNDFFDDLCPMALKFDSCSKIQESSDEEMTAYKLLKKQFSNWQNGFMPYQNLHMRLRENRSHSRP